MSAIGSILRLGQAALAKAGMRVDRVGGSVPGVYGVRVQWKADAPGRTRGVLVDTVVSGQPVVFFVADEFDAIQRVHSSGRFYEEEELRIVGAHFTGGLFADIGANIGNHALYAAKFLNADKVVCVEPNPPALRILYQNINANLLSHKIEVHEVGLSDKEGTATISTPAWNLGGSRMNIGEEGGPLKVIRGDVLFADRPVTFIKIDTEGLEISVLKGLRETIGRHRPKMFVEVDHVNLDAFTAFCAEIGYVEVEQYRRYENLTNFLVAPTGS